MDIKFPEGADRLPRHRAKIEAACRFGIDLPQLAGMAIAGSFALGIADEHSDVDLKLVTTDAGYDAVVDAQTELIAACGTPVARFPADHTGLPELTIVLYDDLVHVDLLPVKLSELADKNQGLPAQVLWERDGSLTRELAKSRAASMPPDVQWMEQRVWTWFWYLHSKILRGEIYEALDGLAWFRATVLFPLLGATRGSDVSGARRIEALMKDLDESFARTTTRADRAEAMDALRASSALYLKLADPLLKERGVELAAHARSTVSAALEAGLGWAPTRSSSGAPPGGDD